MKPRSWLAWDRYAWLHVAERHHLAPSELLVLVWLACVADIRTGTYSVTVKEMADELHLTWRAAKAALVGLEAEGVVLVETPFAKNRPGVLRVVVYEDLIRTQHSRNMRGSSARHQRDMRDVAGVARRNAHSLGISGEGDRGGEWCQRCGEPVEGHPYNHEPVSVISRLGDELPDEFEE